MQRSRPAFSSHRKKANAPAAALTHSFPSPEGNAHVKTAETSVAFQMKATWPASVASLDAWLQQQPLEDLHKHFQEEGYIKVRRKRPRKTEKRPHAHAPRLRQVEGRAKALCLPLRLAVRVALSRDRKEKRGKRKEKAPIPQPSSRPGPWASIGRRLTFCTRSSHSPAVASSWRTCSSQRWWRATAGFTAAFSMAPLTRRRTATTSARTRSRSRRAQKTSRKSCGRRTTLRACNRYGRGGRVARDSRLLNKGPFFMLMLMYVACVGPTFTTKGPLHQRVGAVAKALLGDDVEFDFDSTSPSAETLRRSPRPRSLAHAPSWPLPHASRPWP